MTSALTQVSFCLRYYAQTARRELGILIAFFLFFPLGFLFFLSILVPVAERPQILVGSVLMEIALININVLAQGIGQDKENRIFDLWVSFPISPTIYVLGNALPWLPVSLGVAGATILMGVALFSIHVTVSPLLLCLALCLIWSSTAGIGYVVAVYGGTPRQVNLLAQFIGIVMTFFAPIYYPVSALPWFAQYVAYLWPLTWSAILLKALFANDLASALLALVVLVVDTTIGFTIIGLGLRWRDS